MATVEQIEEKLLSLINQKDSFAIALKGEWGIGKTHFWKSFYKNNHDKFKIGKYSYVSLFGLDSLESFKYQIAINTHDTNKKTDNFLSVKKLFSYIKDKILFPKVEIKRFSLAITQTMINSLISNFIEDTVICIDDFERKSDKLDTREIMGVVNFLKEEKKCKIIMILHEDKSRDLEVFREYREKVFDDTLKLDNNLSIIRSLINNNEVFDLYERFYNSSRIKNLRFYKKVNKDYQSITSLSEQLSLASKRFILENILIINLVFEKGKIELNTDGDYLDVDFLSNYNLEDDRKKVIAFNSYLYRVYKFGDFSYWGKLILQYFTKYKIDGDILEEQIARDLISEKRIEEIKELDQIWEEYRDLNPGPDFIKRLKKSIIVLTKSMNIKDAYFFYKIIKQEEQNSTNEFEDELLKIIDENLKSNNAVLNKICSFKGDHNDSFSEKFDEIVKKYKNIQEYSEVDGPPFLGNNNTKSNESIDFDSITKEQLKEIIWKKLNNNQDRREHIVFIISESPEEKREEIRQSVVDILQESSREKPNSKAMIKMWLEDTNELRNLKEYWKE